MVMLVVFTHHHYLGNEMRSELHKGEGGMDSISHCKAVWESQRTHCRGKSREWHTPFCFQQMGKRRSKV